MADPGYEVVKCIEPKVAQDIVSIEGDPKTRVFSISPFRLK
jgi:hypothetical protein